MRRFSAKPVALGGALGAVALLVMGMGGLIPIATYVCPMLCCMLGFVVRRSCGKRIAWAWYGAVAILSLLLAPDREGAVIYLVLGYYPIVKSSLDRVTCGFVLKLLMFNASIAAAYSVMIYLLGMGYLLQETESLGAIGLAVMLFLGNVTFFLLDRVLWILSRKI